MHLNTRLWTARSHREKDTPLLHQWDHGGESRQGFTSAGTLTHHTDTITKTTSQPLLFLHRLRWLNMDSRIFSHVCHFPGHISALDLQWHNIRALGVMWRGTIFQSPSCIVSLFVSYKKLNYSVITSRKCLYKVDCLSELLAGNWHLHEESSEKLRTT